MSESPEYIKEFDAMRDRVISKWPNVSPDQADEIADFALKVKREAYEDAAHICHKYYLDAGDVIARARGSARVDWTGRKQAALDIESAIRDRTEAK